MAPHVARPQYGIQGWKMARIYPDFIFAVQGQGEAKRITVLETKGDQLDNLDNAIGSPVLAKGAGCNWQYQLSRKLRVTESIKGRRR